VKITDSESIKNGERDLINAITGDLDRGNIEEIFKDKFNLGMRDHLEYKQGDIVVHDNQIAYKLDFEAKVAVSVLCDRSGNYLSLTTSEDISELLEEVPSTDPDVYPKKSIFG
jgi:hypothetical protein